MFKLNIHKLVGFFQLFQVSVESSSNLYWRAYPNTFI